MKPAVRNERAYLSKGSLPGLRNALRTVLFVALILMVGGCSKQQDLQDLASRMAELEGEAANDQRIQELKREIRTVDAQVEKTIESVRNKGTYYRLLGLKYMDYQMWGEALEAFDEAFAIHPDHAALVYNRGLCAGQMALAAFDAETRERYITEAEAAYRRSLALEPRYTPAMYALAVILVFERNASAEAVIILEDFLRIERSDIPGRFLLARAYLDVGRPGSALELYDFIMRNARNPEDEQKAADLYRRVSEGEYAS